MRIQKKHDTGLYAGRGKAVVSAAVFLLCGMILCMVFVKGVQAQESAAAEETVQDAGSGTGTPSEHRQLKITVLEDIPAAEIEDSAVPLAAVPGTEAHRGLQHVLWMGALLAAAAVYVLYFSRYDRRLFLLRKKAAEAEQTCRMRLRAEHKE